MVANNLKLLIKSNFKAFISILALTLLGVGFFVGMKISVPDLKKTVNDYYDKYNYMDIMLSSNLGFNEEELEKLNALDGVEQLEGAYQKDIVVKGKKSEVVVRIHSYNDEKDAINQLEVIDGRLPVNNNEIAIEYKMFNNQKYELGETIYLDSDLVKEKELTIVGSIKSPMYLSSNKGSTNLLSGKVNYYAFINQDNVISDLYSNAYIKIKHVGDYEEKIANIVTKLKDEGKAIISERYSETIEEYTKLIDDKQGEIDSKRREVDAQIAKYETEIINAELEIEAKEKSIPSEKEAEVILNNKRVELEKIKKQLDEANKKIESSEKSYNSAKKLYDAELKVVNSSIKEQERQINEYNEKINKLKNENNELKNELNNATDQNRIEEINNQISSNNREIRSYEVSLGVLKSLYSAATYNLDRYKEELENAKSELDNAKSEYNASYQEYQKASDLLNAKSAKEIIEAYKKEINASKKKLESKKKELEEKKKSVLDEFEKYQRELDDAKDYLKLISNSDWTIDTRETTTSYSQYISDIARIEKISNFFPIIFYLVAILITLTNITRIVEREREDIGLLKALGYSRKQIDDGYLLFAFISSFIGAILGSVIGLFFIPKLFYQVYKLIYYLPTFVYTINWPILIIAISLAIILIVGSAYISCRNTLKEWPVTLLRPKINEKGKRVIFEKIGFIWNKLSFTNRVTFRNLVKYPKRSLMTICGISGCISLIIAGFSLRSAISNIIPLQYGDIFDVNIQVLLRNSLSRSEIEEEKLRINELDEVNNSVLVSLKNVKVNDSDYKVYLVIPEDNDLLGDFVNLKMNSKDYELSDNGGIISEKIAKLLNIKVNDIITVKDADNNIYEVKIEAICNNYVDNYLYISKEYYNNQIKSYPKYNTLLVTTNDSSYDEVSLSKKINANNSVSYLTYTSSAERAYNNIMQSLNYIVYILVISAIILAFIVLYNLNSLNVEERRREIATLKVLGFKKKEVNKYIENEIKVLTVIGIIIGIVLGYIFSNILISSCELDNLLYDYSVVVKNYVYAIVITIIFMIITCLLSRKTLNKINMVESLKKME